MLASVFKFSFIKRRRLKSKMRAIRRDRENTKTQECAHGWGKAKTKRTTHRRNRRQKYTESMQRKNNTATKELGVNVRRNFISRPRFRKERAQYGTHIMIIKHHCIVVPESRTFMRENRAQYWWIAIVKFSRGIDCTNRNRADGWNLKG